MYKRNATLLFAICFLGGIFVSSFFDFGGVYKLLPSFHMSHYYFLGFFILGLILVQVLGGVSYKRMPALITVFMLAFFVGVIAHQNSLDPQIKDRASHISNYNDKDKITFLGKVANYPDLRIDKTQYEIEVIELVEIGFQPIREHTSGKVLLTTNRYPTYEYGDILEITGKLKTPAEFPDFNYKDYLSKDGIYSVIYYPQITRINCHPERSRAVGETESKDLISGIISYNEILRLRPSGSAQNDTICVGGIGTVFWKNIFSFKTKLRESFYGIFPVPHSAILSAMVLGDKRLMSDELKDKLSVTGMRHIVAISGLHILILIKIFESIGFRIGLWRKQVFYFSLVAIILYILMIGAPASAIRAGVMGLILIFAGSIGRINDPKRIIIFAAAGMLALNPLLLKLDIGFQLSFLAVIGIMYLKPYFEKWLKFLPKKVLWNFFPVRGIAAMTLAAQTTTLPVVIYNFGIISFISPIINVLVVPLLSFIMPFAVVAGIGGIFFTKIFLFLSWPLYIMLSYVVFMVDFFSKIPLGFIQTQGNISFLWFIPWYIIISVFIRKYKII